MYFYVKWQLLQSIHLFPLLWLTNLFLKKGVCKIDSLCYSQFTVEHMNMRSLLLFLQPKLTSFLHSPWLLLTPLSGLFYSNSSKIPLQKVLCLSAMELSLLSLPTTLHTSPYKFTFWSRLLHPLYTFFPCSWSQGSFSAHTGINPPFSSTYFPGSLLLWYSKDLKNIMPRGRLEILLQLFNLDVQVSCLPIPIFT